MFQVPPSFYFYVPYWNTRAFSLDLSSWTKCLFYSFQYQGLPGIIFSLKIIQSNPRSVLTHTCCQQLQEAPRPPGGPFSLTQCGAAGTGCVLVEWVQQVVLLCAGESQGFQQDSFVYPSCPFGLSDHRTGSGPSAILQWRLQKSMTWMDFQKRDFTSLSIQVNQPEQKTATPLTTSWCFIEVSH